MCGAAECPSFPHRYKTLSGWPCHYAKLKPVTHWAGDGVSSEGFRSRYKDEARQKSTVSLSPSCVLAMSSAKFHPRDIAAFIELGKSISRLSVFAFLLHTLGLEIFAARLRKWRTPEEPKAVLRKSFWIALSRCSIHLLPTIVFAGLIYINYSIFYIGPNFKHKARSDAVYLAVIQIAAKVQELLCIASLTAIVLQFLRSELLGDGVPIGLLGSGTWFSSISSLWSPDFLVAAWWSFTSFRRLRLYALITLAGFIATVIGPASAVLMLPRSQSVPAGGTSYYLPGTASQIWPDTVNASSEPIVCTSANATMYAVCPAGGYSSLRQTLSTFNYTNFGASYGTDYAPQIQAMGPDTARAWWALLVQNPQSLVPPVISNLAVEYWNNLAQTSATQPHAATAIMLQEFMKQWSLAALVSKQPYWRQYTYSYELTASGPAINPLARAFCSTAQNLSANATDAVFPYLGQQNDARTLWASDFVLSDISALERGQTSHMRTQWTTLAPNTFGIPRAGYFPSGLLIEWPWNNGSRVAIGCTVFATWENGTVTSDRSNNYGAWTVDTALSNPNTISLNRPVTLQESWLRSLTPSSPESALDDGLWQPNTLEQLLSDTGYDRLLSDIRTRPQYHYDNAASACVWGLTNASMTDTELWNDNSCNQGARRIYAEFVIATLVADGLSRYGSARAYDIQPALQDWTLLTPPVFNSSRLLRGLPSSSFPSPGLAAQWIAIETFGYAYYACTTTDYLALAVASAYILLVFVYVLGTVWPARFVSSSSWDTVTELLVLCHNSPPSTSTYLGNASAGIERLWTYGKVVQIRAFKPADGRGEAKIRLVVVDDVFAKGSKESNTNDDEDQTKLERVEVDKSYG